MFDQLSSENGDLHLEELFLHDGKKVSTPSSPRKPANDRVVGASVINLRCGIEELSKDNVDCCSRCTIAREVRKMSLASILELVCDTCEKTFIKSSPQISSSAEINQRYKCKCWGRMGSINVYRWGAEIMTK